MKILVSSEAPLGHTGYSVQAAFVSEVFKQLGHEVDYYAWANLLGGVIEAGGSTYYPSVGKMGSNAHFIAEAADADLVFTLQDLWPLPRDFGEKLTELKIPWLAYFPIDAEPLMDAIAYQAMRAHFPIVFSQFGARMMEDAGIGHWYIPHSIDTKTFRPRRPEERKQLRDELGFPQDAFIVSMVATNMGIPSRKAFAEQMEAFAEFKQRVSNAVLYLHTNIHAQAGSGGYPLLLLAQKLGIPSDSLLFCHQVNYAIGLPNTYVADVYAASDVLLAASMGEGFGLPIAEAQASGCPVITQDFSSMPELTKNGISVSRGYRHWRAPCDYHYVPRIEDITEALHSIRSRSSAISEYENSSGVEFIRANYSRKVIAEKYWAPFISHVEHRLAEMRTSGSFSIDGQEALSAAVAAAGGKR